MYSPLYKRHQFWLVVLVAFSAVCYTRILVLDTAEKAFYKAQAQLQLESKSLSDI